MRPEEDIIAARYDERIIKTLEGKGGASTEFSLAIQAARQACAEAGLDLTFDENGKASLSEFQVHKTLRHTREDASATLILQHAILRRLDRNRNLLWAIIALLLLIAIK